MSLDLAIQQQREAKVAALRAAGGEPYPHRFAFTHTVPQVHAAYDAVEGPALEAARPAVRVAGRLIQFRPHGKAGFGHLQQGGERLQIYVRQDSVAADIFALWKDLDLGDHVGVGGYLFRTKTNELTVHVETMELLAKALLPMPEKWHGLVDVEARYRQRYLDLIANEDARRIFVQRARLTGCLRDLFHARGYIEVETPMMQPLAGGAAARPFRTHHEALDLPLYLRIAPELYLKRLVVGGMDRVFEINRNFRNEGISTQHNPEFTMLEFYEAYSDYAVLMDWSELLLAETARRVNGSTASTFRGEFIDFARCRRLSLRAAIREFWPAAAGAPPSLEEIHDPAREGALAQRYNAFAAGRQDYATIPPAPPGSHGVGVQLLALFEQLAERHLVQPTIIHDFPLAV